MCRVVANRCKRWKFWKCYYYCNGSFGSSRFEKEFVAKWLWELPPLKFFFLRKCEFVEFSLWFSVGLHEFSNSTATPSCTKETRLKKLVMESLSPLNVVIVEDAKENSSSSSFLNLKSSSSSSFLDWKSSSFSSSSSPLLLLPIAHDNNFYSSCMVTKLVARIILPLNLKPRTYLHNSYWRSCLMCDLYRSCALDTSLFLSHGCFVCLFVNQKKSKFTLDLHIKSYQHLTAFCLCAKRSDEAHETSTNQIH